jgi:hypothetical protein
LQGDESEKPAYVSDISANLEAGKKDEVLNQIASDSSILLSAPVKGMCLSVANLYMCDSKSTHRSVIPTIVVEAEGALNLVIAILQGNPEVVKPFINSLVDEDSDRFNIKQKT